MEKLVVEIVLFIALLIICIWRITNRREESQAAKMQPLMDLGQMKQVAGRVTNLQAVSLAGVDRFVYITLNYAAEGEYIRYKDITLMLTDSDRYRLPLIGHIVKVFFEGPDVEQHAIPDERVIRYISPDDSLYFAC